MHVLKRFICQILQCLHFQDIESDSNENCDDDDDDDVRGGPEQGDTVEEMQELPGKKITMVMVQKWVRALEKVDIIE